MKIEWSGRTEAGAVRETNEDAFSINLIDASAARPADAVGRVDGLPAHGALFSVADGVGGQNAGEVASARAVAGIGEELARFPEPPGPLPSREVGRRLELAVRRTNGRIRQEAAADPGKKDMAATLSCLWLVGRRGIFGQVGDSRLYRYRAGDLAQLSHDQSEVGRQVRAGKLAESEAKLTIGRNLLDQALGVRDETLAPEIDWIEVLPGDLFLLCSDGLVDRLHDADLAACLSKSLAGGGSLGDAADALMRRAAESKSRDNVTVLLVRAGREAEETPRAASPTGRAAGNRPLAGPLALAALVGAGIGAAGVFFGSSRDGQAPGAPASGQAQPPGPLAAPAVEVVLQTRLDALAAELAELRRRSSTSALELARAEALLAELRRRPAGGTVPGAEASGEGGNPQDTLERAAALLAAVRAGLESAAGKPPPSEPGP